MTALARSLEALLFLSPDPVALADARARPRERGRGGPRRSAELRDAPRRPRAWCCARSPAAGRSPSHPEAEEAARRLLAKPRTPPLTPAQAETLAIVAYLQPVSRPEIARIRGVASSRPTAALIERGLIEEAGRSQFGAVLYRTTALFLKLFGLPRSSELPDVAQWDPTPEDQAALRERLLRAGDERSGAGATSPAGA